MSASNAGTNTMPPGKVLAFVVGCLLAAPLRIGWAQTQSPSDGRRLALVIANGAYPLKPRADAAQDAKSVSTGLRSAGFVVTAFDDVDYRRFANALSRFAADLQPNDVALVFYVGHAVQVERENYLLPTDFGDDASDLAVRTGAISVNEVQRSLRRARMSVIVLDACSESAASALRPGLRGLAPMDARGGLIAYAATANQLAVPASTAESSAFSRELGQALQTPGLSLREAFFQVRDRIRAASTGRQFPAVFEQLLSDFVLIVAPESSSAPALAAPPNERDLWEAIRNSRDPETFDAFLRQFPNSRFKNEAIGRAEMLRAHRAVRSPAEPSSPVQGRIKVPSAIVRAAPEPNGAAIATLTAGAVLDVTGQRDRWMSVLLPPDVTGLRRAGFVAADAVESQDFRTVRDPIVRAVYPWEHVNISTGYSYLAWRSSCLCASRKYAFGFTTSVVAKTTPVVGLVAEVTRNADLTSGYQLNTSTVYPSLWTFQGGIRIGTDERHAVQPFGQFIAGAYWSGDNGDGSFVMQPGLGVDFRVSSSFRIRLQSDVLMLLPKISQQALRMGLSGVFRIGPR